MRILKAECENRYPLCVYVTASTTLPVLLMGMEKWLELLLGGPATARDTLLAKCSEFTRMEIAALRRAGADVVVYSTPFGTTGFVGRRRFTDMILPWMRRDLEGVDRTGLVYYCGMEPFNDVIDDARRELGFDIFYISPLADLDQAIKIIGDTGLTCGVIDDIRMVRWTPAEVRAEVRRICGIGARHGRFLFGTGVMPALIPEANIRAMVEAAYEYGQYR